LAKAPHILCSKRQDLAALVRQLTPEMQPKQRASSQCIPDDKPGRREPTELVLDSFRREHIGVDEAQGRQERSGKSPKSRFEEITVDTKRDYGTQKHRSKNEPLRESDRSMNEKVCAEFRGGSKQR
jgi:hypothetical protein